jgi:hypothetical protein
MQQRVSGKAESHSQLFASSNLALRLLKVCGLPIFNSSVASACGA